MLELLRLNGCRAVALGIESGSERLLKYMGKRITPEMTRSVVHRLTEHGISIKGYFILGFPTETREELNATVRQVFDLWDIAEDKPGCFRASVFEFRPYPGTPEWHRHRHGQVRAATAPRLRSRRPNRGRGRGHARPG